MSAKITYRNFVILNSYLGGGIAACIKSNINASVDDNSYLGGGIAVRID
jgi:hypothetical protein